MEHCPDQCTVVGAGRIGQLAKLIRLSLYAPSRHYFRQPEGIYAGEAWMSRSRSTRKGKRKTSHLGADRRLSVTAFSGQRQRAKWYQALVLLFHDLLRSLSWSMGVLYSCSLRQRSRYGGNAMLDEMGRLGCIVSVAVPVNEISPLDTCDWFLSDGENYTVARLFTE